MLAPRRAQEPLSGSDAARHGGRWNEPGQSALYMSETFATAIAEYEQDLGIRPGTLCAYDVDSGWIVDFGDEGACRLLGVTRDDLLCPWKQIALIEHRRPPTLDIIRRLLDHGDAGVRVPSARAGGCNLVLWRWNDAATSRVAALDPLGDLPRDQRSWQPE